MVVICIVQMYCICTVHTKNYVLLEVNATEDKEC